MSTELSAKIAQFREAVQQSGPLDELVEAELLSGPVYAFGSRTEEHLGRLRSHLGEHLGVAEDEIWVVGSAKTGFSLSPDSFPRAFQRNSDIDVVVVDEHLFDQLWLPIARIGYYQRWNRVRGRDAEAMSDLEQKLARGWLSPLRCNFHDVVYHQREATLRDIRAKWLAAFSSLSRFAEFSRRDVSGRLYRTREHVLAYHAQGLEQIRIKLTVNRR